VLRSAPAWQVWVGLWTLYLAWGSTYLAMRVMVRTLPPLLAASARFLVAGLVLCAWIALREGGLRALAVSRSALVACALTGLLLPGLGNGLNTVAAQHMTSGLLALLAAAVPLWIVLLRAGPGRERVGGGTLAGVAVGFAGVALLLLPGGHPQGTRPLGVVLALCGSVAWAGGSFVSRRVDLPPSPLHATALQMLFGGAAQVVLGLATGEAGDLHPSRVSLASFGALAYLSVVGAILSYTAFGWLLHHAPLSQVTTYAFVNPVVAVTLGWAILDEQLTWLTIAGASVIVVAVAAIWRNESDAVP
jgi:drug/metabolite transporter (DMT)-like permease